jgi:hypothetical protein
MFKYEDYADGALLDNGGNLITESLQEAAQSALYPSKRQNKESKNEKCQECHIPLSIPGSMYCDVCSAMRDSLNQTGYFNKVHLEWEEENQSRASHKRQIMGE